MQRKKRARSPFSIISHPLKTPDIWAPESHTHHASLNSWNSNPSSWHGTYVREVITRQGIDVRFEDSGQDAFVISTNLWRLARHASVASSRVDLPVTDSRDAGGRSCESGGLRGLCESNVKESRYGHAVRATYTGGTPVAGRVWLQAVVH